MAEGSKDVIKYIEERQQVQKRLKELDEIIEDMEGRSPPLKKRKELKLNPGSSVTWSKLETEGLIEDFSSFLEIIEDCFVEDTFKESCGTNVENFDSFIANLEEVAIKENEGYPMLFCGLYFTHIVQHLGRDYRMRILPITH